MHQAAAVPEYLNETYWWAYVHPRAVDFFERQWLVNMILWGNFAKLRDAALSELGESLPGRSLQVACVYGDFTPRLSERVVHGKGSLDVVDVLPIQLSNLGRKLEKHAPVTLMNRDASDLGFAADTYDRVILFFLLHEMPLDVRRRTLAEAVRVLKPGQELVIVGFTEPAGAREHFGALLLGYYDRHGDLHYAGRVGTGFDDRMLDSLGKTLRAIETRRAPFSGDPIKRERRAHWVRKELVAHIRVTNWTRDGLLRHPVFLGLREDKPAASVRRELPQVAKPKPRSAKCRKPSTGSRRG